MELTVANQQPGERATPRARYRAQIRQEIKEQALRQLAESGPAGISVNAIGKELGVSGPALYRYFASRDDLLTELVIDAYTDMAAAVHAAVTDVPAESGQDKRAQFEAFARACRSWALAEPHRYRLLFDSPLPGYDPNAARLIKAAQASMELLIEVLPAPSTETKPPGELASQTARWIDARGMHAEASTGLRAVQFWWRLHGFLSLEIAGGFAAMGIEPDALFELELAAVEG